MVPGAAHSNLQKMQWLKQDFMPTEIGVRENGCSVDSGSQELMQRVGSTVLRILYL